MSPRTLQYVAAALGGEILRGDPAACLVRVSTDTRTIRPGDAFLALTGENHDAHQFLGDAVKAGAAVLVVNRRGASDLPDGPAVIVVDETRVAFGKLAARYRIDFDLPVVAVGGSNGKTSTKELIGAVLGAVGPVVASEASFNNDVGVPATLLRIDDSTRVAVVEVGTNHPGELAPLVRMAKPRIGVITSLGREHLEFFGDLDGVVREEGALAEGMAPDGCLIVHGDSPGMDAVVARSGARVIRCGLGSGNDWCAERTGSDALGSDFAVWAPQREYCGRYRVNIVGRHMVGNALLALAVAAELGVRAEAAREGLAKARPAKMRLNLHDFAGVRVLDDAYNANPDSMLAALETLNDLPCAGRRVAVLGYMAELGPHAETAHAEVGRAAARLGVQHLFAVGRHAESMAGAASEASPIIARAFATAAEAARAALESVRPGDLVLVKASRSTRLEQVIDLFRTELPSRALAC